MVITISHNTLNKEINTMRWNKHYVLEGYNLKFLEEVKYERCRNHNEIINRAKTVTFDSIKTNKIDSLEELAPERIILSNCNVSFANSVVFTTVRVLEVYNSWECFKDWDIAVMFPNLRFIKIRDSKNIDNILSILTNKNIKAIVSNCDGTVCVQYSGKSDFIMFKDSSDMLAIPVEDIMNTSLNLLKIGTYWKFNISFLNQLYNFYKKLNKARSIADKNWINTTKYPQYWKGVYDLGQLLSRVKETDDIQYITKTAFEILFELSDRCFFNRV